MAMNRISNSTSSVVKPNRMGYRRIATQPEKVREGFDG
jgi:hypothetical protein